MTTVTTDPPATPPTTKTAQRKLKRALRDAQKQKAAAGGIVEEAKSEPTPTVKADKQQRREKQQRPTKKQKTSAKDQSAATAPAPKKPAAAAEKATADDTMEDDAESTPTPAKAPKVERHSLHLYQQTTNIMHDFLHYKGSIKSLCLAPSVQFKQATMALLTQALKYRYIVLDVTAAVNSRLKGPQQYLPLTRYYAALHPTEDSAAADISNDANKEDLDAPPTDATDVPLVMCGFLLLAYDMLFGEGLPTFYATKKTITVNGITGTVKKDRLGLTQGTSWLQRWKTQCILELHNVMQKRQLKKKDELLPPELRGNLLQRKFPRYMRVNTLLTQKGDVKHALSLMHYKCVDSINDIIKADEDAMTAASKAKVKQQQKVKLAAKRTRDAAAADVTAETKADDESKQKPASTDKPTTVDQTPVVPAPRKVYAVDSYVPNLLIFPSLDTEIIHHELVTSHKLIIQDKSSCLPCVALNAEEGAQAIDACSAPGNKTTLLASMLGAKGHVHAIEKNKKRAEDMKERVHEMGADKIVTVHNQSFLDCRPTDKTFKDVKYILLDPSCSGSGNVSLDRLLGCSYGADGKLIDETATSDRVRDLHNMQVELLQHALTFPSVQRISYSTCSVYELENEAVVSKCLETAKQHGFSLYRTCPSWPRRGIQQSALDEKTKYEWAGRCLRVDPALDHTGGFFVAVFQRTASPAEKATTSMAKQPATTSTQQKQAQGAVKPTAETTSDEQPIKKQKAGNSNKRKG